MKKTEVVEMPDSPSLQFEAKANLPLWASKPTCVFVNLYLYFFMGKFVYLCICISFCAFVNLYLYLFLGK